MESEKHSSLVAELRTFFEKEGYSIDSVDGATYNEPAAVKNEGVGDGQNKIPDIEAEDVSQSRIIRGEAKVGNGDIESEHSITQYCLFSNRNKNGVDSWLCIIVPKGEKQHLHSVIVQNVPERQWKNIQLFESRNY